MFYSFGPGDPLAEWMSTCLSSEFNHMFFNSVDLLSAKNVGVRLTFVNFIRKNSSSLGSSIGLSTRALTLCRYYIDECENFQVQKWVLWAIIAQKQRKSRVLI
jgi:hypothetical protein